MKIIIGEYPPGTFRKQYKKLEGTLNSWIQKSNGDIVIKVQRECGVVEYCIQEEIKSINHDLDEIQRDAENLERGVVYRAGDWKTEFVDEHKKLLTLRDFWSDLHAVIEEGGETSKFFTGGVEKMKDPDDVTVNDTDRYIFRLNGDIRKITYQDEETELREVNGMKYIEYLIRHTNRDVPALELYRIVHPPDTENEGEIEKYFSYSDDANYEISNFAIEHKGGKIERNRLRKLQEKLEDINDKISTFGNNEELETRKEEIIKAIHRDGSTPANKCRVNVTNAITRAINKIDKKKHPKLYAHLKNHIITGSYLKYTPETPIDWEV